MHEAHRHPYIERLALLCLMKLRCGERFGQRAGAYWRLLFVLCVFPWLQQYRLRKALVLERTTPEKRKLMSLLGLNVHGHDDDQNTAVMQVMEMNEKQQNTEVKTSKLAAAFAN